MQIIIGAGCVGLSIAYQLLKKNKKGDNILVIDRYNIPSKGTSLKNSGVLHAGLYYPPDSEKSRLCINGHEALKKLSKDNNLPFLECGKLIMTTNKNQEKNLLSLYENALECKREVSIVDYSYALKIQPNIKKRDFYLWSPKTSVFSPSRILDFFYKSLLESGVKFLNDQVINISNDKNKIFTKENGAMGFDKLYNCAGPGALKIYKKTSNKKNNLSILPILGQYGVIPIKNKIHTNIYPVPDPNLPFLGIHLTPLINGEILIGPNAIPVFKKDIQGTDLDDLIKVYSRLFNHSKLFLSNSQNYRKHALNELTLNVLSKFKAQTSDLFDLSDNDLDSMCMQNSFNGIRPQLYDVKSNKLVNDFIYEIKDNTIHIINAVSPAFTSCMALSEKVVNMNL